MNSHLYGVSLLYMCLNASFSNMAFKECMLLSIGLSFFVVCSNMVLDRSPCVKTSLVSCCVPC